MTRAELFETDRRVSSQLDRMAEAEYDDWLDSRPVCYCCDQPITGPEAVYLNNEYYCLDCIEKHTERI